MTNKSQLFLSFLMAILLACSAASADAAAKKKSKKKIKKTAPVTSPYVIEIGYPSTSAAYSAIKSKADVTPKANNKPFGWQQRGGNWFVAIEPNPAKNHKKNQYDFEWAFTEPGHYAHPSVVKRMIDIGSSDHVYVDMAFRCGAPDRSNCDTLNNEFKEVNLLIRKVYQKKYIQTEDGAAAWDGPDSLE